MRDELTDRIMATAARIKERQEELGSTIGNIFTRAERCVEHAGGTFEPFL